MLTTNVAVITKTSVAQQEAPQPMLASPRLVQHRVHQLGWDDLGQLTDMTRREHVGPARDRLGHWASALFGRSWSILWIAEAPPASRPPLTPLAGP